MLQKGTAFSAILAVLMVMIACGGPPETPTPTQAPTATKPPASVGAAYGGGAPDPGDPTALAEHLRAKTMRLWDVYNTHVLDDLRVFYEENYWESELEELRRNMEFFRTNSLMITGEEVSPPAEISPGRWATRHIARFEGGSVHVVYIYEEFDGEWLLTYAESG